MRRTTLAATPRKKAPRRRSPQSSIGGLSRTLASKHPWSMTLQRRTIATTAHRMTAVQPTTKNILDGSPRLFSFPLGRMA